METCSVLKTGFVKGKDSDRLLWEGREIRYNFGFPDIEPTERGIEDDYLPIVHTKWEDDDVVYQQTAFATWLEKDVLSEERIQGDEPTILLAKVTLTNLSSEKKNISLKLESHSDIEEKLNEKYGFVFATNYESNRMRYFVDVADTGQLKSEDDNLFYELNLEGKESHSIYFKIPFITLTEDREYRLVKNTNYETELHKVKEFWKYRISEGAQIETPEQILNNFYKAHVVHMLINDDREPGEERYMARCGSLRYGVFANEGCMVISDLDRRGYIWEAEKHLETFVYYQDTKMLPGNFSSKVGLYYGAGGYESGAYNQHHGWVLWALGEHYWYSRDRKWLKHIAPSIVKGCDWIIQERKNSKKLDKNGEKVLEYGFLPAGALEDVTEYWYWLATNAYTYFGMKNAALALADIGHPDAERLVEESSEYKKDLLRGFSESMIRAPVVKLRDETYIPHFPSRLYRRGRSFGWIRETLEGAIHLIRCGLIEPSSKEATWIIKDFEDNLYLSERFGFILSDFEKYWFSRGGFCYQPNLLPHPIPYLLRDEPKHFLRGYFNAFAVAFYPDTYMLTEWLPTMEDWGGDHYKTSDEAQSTYWLRLMLVCEQEEELFLCKMIPREWLENGKQIKIESVLTYFGEVGFLIKSDVDDDEISMILSPPRRNSPSSIKVRFRHPDKKEMKRVTVNGEEWSDFDPKEELITLEPKILKDGDEIVAYY